MYNKKANKYINTLKSSTGGYITTKYHISSVTFDVLFMVFLLSQVRPEVRLIFTVLEVRE